jgi:hypothetical protein
VDAEQVKVGIRPAHGDLEEMMQIGDGMVTADAQTRLDHRADAQQHDLELIDAHVCGG